MLFFFNCKSLGAIDPPTHTPNGRAIFDPRDMIRRIDVNLRITTLHIKYRRFGSFSFREEYFTCISNYKTRADDDTPCAGPVWITWARFAGLIKRTTINCCTQNKEALGLVVFPNVSLWELITPGAGPFLTPGVWLAAFIKRTTTHCYKQILKLLALWFRKCFVYVFPMTPPRRGLYGPEGHVWQDL